MIRITTNGKQVSVTMDFCHPASGYSEILTAEESHPVNAVLVAENLRNNLERHIVAIRREEYDRGWSDAKSKKAKSAFFKCVF